MTPIANAQIRPLTPTATTRAADQVMSESAELNAYVDPNGSTTRVGFQYINAEGRADVTAFVNIGVTAQSVSITATGLRPNTTYSFYVVAYNAYGTVTGTTRYFTTLPEPPLAQTQSATAITTNSAALNGMVDPKNAATIAFFQYGPTDSYGSRTANTNCGLAGTNVTFHLMGLSAASTWHYQLVASNAFGVSYGGDMAFTTLSPPARLEPTFFTNSAFRILLHASGPGVYAVDGTSDFVNWDNIGMCVDPQEPTEIIDWQAVSSPMRFYRVYQIPQ